MAHCHPEPLHTTMSAPLRPFWAHTMVIGQSGSGPSSEPCVPTEPCVPIRVRSASDVHYGDLKVVEAGPDPDEQSRYGHDQDHRANAVLLQEVIKQERLKASHAPPRQLFGCVRGRGYFTTTA